MSFLVTFSLLKSLNKFHLVFQITPGQYKGRCLNLPFVICFIRSSLQLILALFKHLKAIRYKATFLHAIIVASAAGGILFVLFRRC